MLFISFIFTFFSLNNRVAAERDVWVFFKLEWPNGVEFLYFGVKLIKRHMRRQVGSELYWHKHTYVIMCMTVDQFIFTGISCERIKLCLSSWNSSGSTKPTKRFNPQKELFTNKKHWHGWEISEWQTAGKERVQGQW